MEKKLFKKLDKLLYGLKENQIVVINNALFYALVIVIGVAFVKALISLSVISLVINTGLLGFLYYINPISLKKLELDKDKETILNFGMTVCILLTGSLLLAIGMDLFNGELLSAIFYAGLTIPVISYLMMLMEKSK